MSRADTLIRKRLDEGAAQWPQWTIRHKKSGGVFALRRAENAHAARLAAIGTHPTLRPKDFEAVPGDVGARRHADVQPGEKHCRDCGGPATSYGSCLSRCGN